MHEKPDAGSFDPNYCPRRVPMAIFQDNHAHSQGWFGIWIFMVFTPMECPDYGCCTGTTPQGMQYKN
jgi:hypothetical protein